MFVAIERVFVIQSTIKCRTFIYIHSIHLMFIYSKRYHPSLLVRRYRRSFNRRRCCRTIQTFYCFTDVVIKQGEE
jgi:hypothetical protein